MNQQKPITRPSHSTDRVERENKPIEPVGIPIDRKRGETDIGRSREQPIRRILHTLQKSWPRCFRLLVNQKKREWSAIRAESRMSRLGPLSYRQPNQCCQHPIRRNSLLRGFSDRRNPLQCTRYTHVAIGFRCHIPCDPEH